MPPLTVREEPLGRFVTDPGASGTVFFVGNDPFLQLHLFPDEYTLFWPSDPNPARIPSLLAGMLATVGSSYAPKVWGTFDEALLSLLIPGVTGLTEEKQQFNLVTLPGARATAPMAIYLGQFWPTAVSFYGELSSRHAPAKFGVWSDTLTTPTGPRETGITASYDTMDSSAVSQLILGSSAFAATLDSQYVTTVLQRYQTQHRL